MESSNPRPANFSRLSGKWPRKLRLFIISDALDECRHSQELLTSIEEMVGWKKEKLHMLATSRKEPDIEECPKPLVSDQGVICIQSALVNNDIRTYVHERLQND